MGLGDDDAAKTHCITPGASYNIPVNEPSRLDAFLLRQFPSATVGGVRRFIASGTCMVDGIRRTSGYVVQPGQEVQITGAHLPEMRPECMPLEILYEDDTFLAVNKPAGMLSHPTWRERSGTVANALMGLLSARGQSGVRPALLHRLDRGTSGVLLAAKWYGRKRPGSRLFEMGGVVKKYLAIICGAPEWDFLTVDQALGRSPGEIPQWRASSSGMAAVTSFEVVSRRGRYTLLAATPVTGRTNQIRIHAAVAGFPLLGDPLYGGDPADRLYLHSWRLRAAIFHTLPSCTVEAPIPECFSDWVSGGSERDDL